MRGTDNEVTAARQLADALVRFLAAVADGTLARLAQRPREEITVRLEQPPAVPAPEPPQSVAPPPPGRPERLLLTAKEAAAFLSIGGRLLWSMSAPRGPIPIVRIGRSIRYASTDLEAFVNRSRIRPRKG